jgi:hypothetical protein
MLSFFLAAVIAAFVTTDTQAASAADRAAQNARIRSGMTSMPGGGFVGIVPANAITDPVNISTGIFVPTSFDYGDGTTVTYKAGDTPAHTYTQPGRYKPTISSSTLGTAVLNYLVPFDSNQSNVFGLGVTYPNGTGTLADPIEFLITIEGTGTIDFGDGSAPMNIDSSTNATHVYAKAGSYTAVVTSSVSGSSPQSGSIRFDAPLSNKNASGKFPSIDVSDVSITPNPAQAGDTITFSASVTGANLTSEPSADLDFGDGTHMDSIAISGNKGTTTHAYNAEGVYRAVLTISGGGAEAIVDAYVVVGNKSAVNSLNGLISTANIDAAGLAKLNIVVSNIPGATTATTTFDDTVATSSLAVAAAFARASVPVDGLLPTRNFTAPTLSVATSVAKDNAGKELGKIRKMVPVGAKAAGDSAALPTPTNNKVAIKKLTGKFAFGKDTADQVGVSGGIELPAGFNPAAAGGNTLVVGVGNVVDKVTVDEKGKAQVPAGGHLKSISIKYPKLAGPAPAGTIATISVALSYPKLSQLGFDTEGISSTRRADESHLKVLPRFVQVSLLFAGVPYEIYAPVTYKLSMKGDVGAGSIQNIRTK